MAFEVKIGNKVKTLMTSDLVNLIGLVSVASVEDDINHDCYLTRQIAASIPLPNNQQKFPFCRTFR